MGSILSKFFSLCLLLLLLSGCAATIDSVKVPTPSDPAVQIPTNVNVFDSYMQSDSLPADGFDFPFGHPERIGIFHRASNITAGILPRNSRKITVLAFTLVKIGMVPEAVIPTWDKRFMPLQTGV
jgi:hypothetical protein